MAKCCELAELTFDKCSLRHDTIDRVTFQKRNIKCIESFALLSSFSSLKILRLPCRSIERDSKRQRHLSSMPFNLYQRVKGRSCKYSSSATDELM